MKSAALARPNLKAILLGAIVVSALAQMLHQDPSDSLLTPQARAHLDNRKLDQYLGTLLRQAATTPDPELYARISNVYERKREYRRALFFLREADKLYDLPR